MTTISGSFQNTLEKNVRKIWSIIKDRFSNGQDSLDLCPIDLLI
jgi:hypothetical protein